MQSVATECMNALERHDQDELRSMDDCVEKSRLKHPEGKLLTLTHGARTSQGWVVSACSSPCRATGIGCRMVPYAAIADLGIADVAMLCTSLQR